MTIVQARAPSNRSVASLSYRMLRWGLVVSSLDLRAVTWLFGCYMHIYIYVIYYTHMYDVFIHTYSIHIYIYIHIHMNACMHACRQTDRQTEKNIYIHYTYMYDYVCIYIYMYKHLIPCQFLWIVSALHPFEKMIFHWLDTQRPVMRFHPPWRDLQVRSLLGRCCCGPDLWSILMNPNTVIGQLPILIC